MTLVLPGKNEEQTAYTKERVRFLLREYPRLAQHCRLPAREEVLGTTPGPKSEAADLATHRMKADIEQALQLVPYTWAQITFMALSVGNSDWRFAIEGMRRLSGKARKREALDWYEVVAEWWGMGADSKGELSGAAGVARIVDDTLELVWRELNT
jgi:hypothetical protein